MKKIVLIAVSTIALSANTYMGKIEPIEIQKIAAETSGKVVKLRHDLVGKLAGKRPVVTIFSDTFIDEFNNAKIAHDTLQKTYNVRQAQYNRAKNIQSKTVTQKENLLLGMLGAKNSLNNATVNLSKMTTRANNFKVLANGLFISDILVKTGQFVQMGTPLFTAFDVSTSKIIIYANKEDLTYFKLGKFKVNGAQGNYKARSVSFVTDSKYLSQYRVELVGAPPKIFGLIATIETVGDSSISPSVQEQDKPKKAKQNQELNATK